MNIFQNIPLFFIGDNHGQYEQMFNLIQEYDLSNCYLIHLGDGGEGFLPMGRQIALFLKLNDLFRERNVFYKSIRGNHSDPFYFKGSIRINLSHFELLEDYTVVSYKNNTIQFIGGAISIDRTSRIEGQSYWKDEVVVYEPDLCKPVDVLVTHTAPSWCFPQQINDMVRSWCYEDKSLLADLKEERKILDKIAKKCKPKLHLYGHFHTHSTEMIDGTLHKLLNINEIWELTTVS